MKTALVIIVLLALVALAVSWAVYAWIEIGEVEMGMHGWVAMVLGVVFSFIIGGGLMTLMFYSSRHGYDEVPDLSERSDEDLRDR